MCVCVHLICPFHLALVCDIFTRLRLSFVVVAVSVAHTLCDLHLSDDWYFSQLKMSATFNILYELTIYKIAECTMHMCFDMVWQLNPMHMCAFVLSSVLYIMLLDECSVH